MAIFSAKITPTIIATAYTAEDSVGGVIEIKGAPREGIIESWSIQDDGDVGAVLELLFFESEPVGVADADSFLTPSDADMQLCIGYLKTGTYVDHADSQFVHAENVGMAYATKGGSLWMIVRAEGTPNYDATDDLTFRFNIVY